MKTREWLFYNAVMAWLVNYAEKGDPELVKQYQDLLKELDNEKQTFTFFCPPLYIFLKGEANLYKGRG